MNRLIVDLEFKLDDGGQIGTIKGYGSTFGNVDLGKDRCMKGCFMDSLKSGMPAMFWQHDPGEPIGEWSDVSEDAKGLKVTGNLWLGKGIPKAEQAYMMLKANGPKGLSIGYRTRNASYDEKTGVRSLLQVDLKEISVVSFPMNEKAKVTSIKSHIADGLVPTIRDLEEILRDAGLSAKATTLILTKGYDAYQRDVGAPSDNGDVIAAIGTLINTLKA